MPEEPVVTMDDFVKKYGWRGPHLLIEKYIESPSEERAKALGILSADLQFALRNFMGMI